MSRAVVASGIVASAPLWTSGITNPVSSMLLQYPVTVGLYVTWVLAGLLELT